MAMFSLEAYPYTQVENTVMNQRLTILAKSLILLNYLDLCVRVWV